ncbi:acyltransferase family protein [Hymenobacter crusticola]|uniref:acyltransferase family protein n=1 Tax=Hymenobacter crusticola TaxID=1770526 RepID=UPI001C4E4E34|nr:acyltransferase [Hymenobacter crusticola]
MAATEEDKKNEVVTTPKKKFVEGLTFLRGVAALCVCLYHFTGGALPKIRDPRIEMFFSNGWLGVDIFFVLSGFIIPYSLLGKQHGINGFLAYMKKRVVRINPPAYVALALVLMQGFFIDYIIAHKVVYTAGVSWGQILNNILFTVPFSKYKWVLGIFWTLAIEFQFYIIIGLIFRNLFEDFNVYKFVIIFTLLNIIQYLPFQSNENFFRFSLFFALGGTALLYYIKKINIIEYFILLLIFSTIAYFQLSFYMALTGFVSAIVISFARFKHPAFDFLGKISYSFYLLHVLIGTTCEYFLIKIVDPTSLVNKILILALCLLFAILGSYVFYLVIEKKFIALANSVGVRKNT